MGQENSHPQPANTVVYHERVYHNCTFFVVDGHFISVKDGGALFLPPSSTREAMAKEEVLKIVARHNKSRVNNKDGRSYTPQPVDEIIQRAEHWMDKEVPYDVVGSNCEIIVTYRR